MEWTGVMELRRPMRTFEVEGAGSLGNGRERRKSGGEIVSVYF